MRSGVGPSIYRRTASCAGHVRMAESWILRKGTPKSGFRYLRPDGKMLRDGKALARITRLRVPPAWREAHIAADPRRAIQAWGYDARDRKQSRSHERAAESREPRKYHRARQLAKALPRVRRELRTQSHKSRLDCDTACAVALRLVSETLFRPGSEKYLRENGSHGITTLRKRHVELEARRAVFTYRGKSGKAQRQIVTNPELLQLVRKLMRTPGNRLFRYRASDAWCDLDAATLIDFLRRRIGQFAVKDFRTWGGTLRAAIVL